MRHCQRVMRGTEHAWKAWGLAACPAPFAPMALLRSFPCVFPLTTTAATPYPTGRVHYEDFRNMAEQFGMQLDDDSLLALFYVYDPEGGWYACVGGRGGGGDMVVGPAMSCLGRGKAACGEAGRCLPCKH